MTRNLRALLTGILCLVGLAEPALADIGEINLAGPQTAIDLTAVLTEHQVVDNQTEVSAVLNSYPEGTAYYVDLYNGTDTDTNRLLVFTYPLLMKSSLFGPSIHRPHVADVVILSGDATVDLLATGAGDVFGAATLQIPAGEHVRIGFSYEGSKDGAGIYLWQPASYNEFSSYRLWSNGVFLGMISLLAAFGLGVALVSWRRREGYQLALLITAWVLEYVWLNAAVDGYWRVIALSLFGLALISYVLAHVEEPKGILANGRTTSGIRIAMLLPFVLALFQLQMSMTLVRIEILLLGIFLGALVFLPPTALGRIGGSVRFGLQAIFVTGGLATVLPFFNWQSGALVIERFLYGFYNSEQFRA